MIVRQIVVYRNFVGADAHIGPIKNVGILRADVGIGPYKSVCFNPINNNLSSQFDKLPIVQSVFFCYNNKKCYYIGCVKCEIRILECTNP